MKKLAIVGILFLSILTLVSCESKTVYDEFTKIEDLRFDSDAEFVYEFNNIDPTKEYDVILMFRYAQGYQFNQMVLELSYEAENGNEMSIPIGLIVKDEKGNYQGDGSGDIWDIEHKIMSGKALPKGKNIFKITGGMPYKYVPMVMGVGIKVVEAE